VVVTDRGAAMCSCLCNILKAETLSRSFSDDGHSTQLFVDDFLPADLKTDNLPGSRSLRQ
jgi:hypothetical protein